MATVTVGVPVYNAGKWVEGALAALQAQTHDDLVIHVADNGSTDDTGDLVQAIAAEDERVVYERHATNLGAVANFNHVAAAARTPWFKWAAADDLHRPAFVERCLVPLQADPSLVLAHPRTTAIDDQGQPKTSHLIPGPGMDIVGYEDHTNIGPGGVDEPDPIVRFRKMMRELWYTPQLFGVMRTSTLHATKLHPFHYMGDHILLAELVLHGPFHEVDETLFLHRLHDEQTSMQDTGAERVAVNAKDRAKRPKQLKVASAYPRRLRLHLDGISRAPLTTGQKMRCRGVIAEVAAGWVKDRARR